ncbi:uncharacterized protein [Antedon mediterranea]|uniref:uncharacterized protein n=1 Tax=Antedon mediterranea TaxID=105859 RepID=UPI003AF907D7
MFAFVPAVSQSVDLTCFESLLPDDVDERIANQKTGRYYVEEYINDDCLVPNLQVTHESIPVVTSIYDGSLQDLFNDESEEESETLQKCNKPSSMVVKSPPRSPQLRHQLNAATTTIHTNHQTGCYKDSDDPTSEHSFFRTNYATSSNALLLDDLRGNFAAVNVSDDEREVPGMEVERRRCTAREEEEQLVPNWYQSEE